MCDTVWVRGDGRSLFAKNSDRPVSEVQLVRTGPGRPRDEPVTTQYLTIAGTAGTPSEATTSSTNPWIGAGPTWLWGLEHGVNGARVAVGNEKLYTVADGWSVPPGLLGMDLVRLALERAGTVAEAVDVIGALVERHGQGGVADQVHGTGYSSSFLVADPTSAWIIETCDRQWVAAPADRGAAISNRIALSAADVARHSPDLEDGVDPQAWIAPDAVLARADRRLACTVPGSGAATEPADLAAALARHHGTAPWGRPGDANGEPEPVPVAFDEHTAEGISVCMHLRGDTATTSSMIAELPESPDEPVRMWMAPGSPCVSVFVPTFLSIGAPPVLGDASMWQRVARLRDRVEAPGPDGAEALAAIRAVLAPLETDLWGEAASIWDGGGDPARARHFAARANRAVRDALVALTPD